MGLTLNKRLLGSRFLGIHFLGRVTVMVALTVSTFVAVLSMHLIEAFLFYVQVLLVLCLPGIWRSEWSTGACEGWMERRARRTSGRCSAGLRGAQGDKSHFANSALRTALQDMAHVAQKREDALASRI